MRNKRNFTSLIALLRELEDQGSLEPEKQEAFAKAKVRLIHALKVGTRQEVLKAIDDLARVLVG